MYETMFLETPAGVNAWLNKRAAQQGSAISIVGYSAEAGSERGVGGIWITIKYV